MKLKPLVMTLGTGGVGKTTVSLALAYGLARRGERTFLLTVDPAKRLYDLANKVVAEIPNLHLVRLDVGKQFAEMVVRHSPDRSTADAVLKSRFFPYLTDHLPGFHEYVASEVILAALKSGEYDRLVIDTPPFAYALHFLEAPERLGKMAGLAATLFQVGGGRGISPLMSKGLSLFLGSGFLTELLEFISAFAQVWPGIEATSKGIAQAYREQTSFAAVVVPDGRSTDDLLSFMRGTPEWLKVQYLIVNRAWESGVGVFEPPGGGSDVESVLNTLPTCLLVGPSTRRELAREVSEAYGLAKRMKASQDHALERVEQAFPALSRSIVMLPMLSGGVTGRVSLDWISDRLMSELQGL